MSDYRPYNIKDDLDSDGHIYGLSAIMPLSTAGLGLSMYNSQWAMLKHFADIEVIYGIIHSWTPDFQKNFWTFSLGSIVHTGPLLARAGCLFNWLHVESGSFAQAHARKIADTLGEIFTWELVRNTQKQEIVVGGVKFISFGADQMRAQILFNLIAMAFNDASTEISLDQLAAVSPRIGRLIFGPGLIECIRLNEGSMGFWGSFGILVSLFRSYVFDERAAYAAAALVLESRITDDLLNEGGCTVQTLEEVKDVVNSMVISRTNADLAILQDVYVQLVAPSTKTTTTTTTTTTITAVSSTETGLGENSMVVSAPIAVIKPKKVRSKPGLAVLRPTEFAYKNPVAIVSADHHNTMPYAGAVELLNDDFSRTYHYHSFMLYEKQRLCFQKKREWFYEIGRRATGQLMDGAFNHLTNALKARQTPTRVFYVGVPSSPFQFAFYQPGVSVYLPIADDGSRYLDYLDPQRVPTIRSGGPSRFQALLRSDPNGSVLVVDGVTRAENRGLDVGGLLNPLHSLSHDFALKRLSACLPRSSTNIGDYPLLVVVRMTMINDGSHSGWKNLFFNLKQAYHIYYYPSTDVFGPEFSLVLLRRLEFVPNFYYKKEPLAIIQEIDMRRVIAQSKLFSLVTEHKIPLIAIGIISYHAQQISSQHHNVEAVQFDRMNQTRIIDDSLELYDPKTISSYYKIINKEIIGDAGTKRARKYTGQDKIKGLSVLATASTFADKAMNDMRQVMVG